jgi:hypothetical protein
LIGNGVGLVFFLCAETLLSGLSLPFSGCLLVTGDKLTCRSSTIAGTLASALGCTLGFDNEIAPQSDGALKTTHIAGDRRIASHETERKLL